MLAPLTMSTESILKQRLVCVAVIVKPDDEGWEYLKGSLVKIFMRS